MGIAVAVIGSEGPPELLDPVPRWSRADVRDWLMRLAEQQADMLIGFDLSMGLPFADEGDYFPQWDKSPQSVRDLWAMIDDLSQGDEHLAVSGFLGHVEAARYFRHGQGVCGDRFLGGAGRLRVVESHQRATGQANSASCFNLVGAGQVGKASLTGMRVLHQLGGRIPIWPFDPIPRRGPVIVEIYTTVAAMAAGLPKGRSKMRDRVSLEKAMAGLGCEPPKLLTRYDDHRTDALLTAAWLRKVAGDRALWNPGPLTTEIAQKEGWTFGIV